ncbi:MAG: type II secretion system protein [Verrucomicrobiota bacterium]
MKTITSDTWRVTSDEINNTSCGVHPRHGSRVTCHVSAFTLIELLVVIAIIGTLAGLLFPVVGAVKRQQYIRHAQAEMAQLETAIDRYKSVYGFYPPSPPNSPAAGNTASYVNQLYYELVGTIQTNIGGTPCYTTLDGGAQIGADNATMTAAFGVGGFVNCTKPGAGEDAAAARNFLPELRPTQMGTIQVGNSAVWVTNLITSVGGPDASYKPLGQQDINPWRYNSSSPTNNPGSYDLWIQLSIAGKSNLVCNWSKQVQIGSLMP